MRGNRIIILLCALIVSLHIGAQQRFLPPVESTDSTAVASLLTCAPGADVYTLEGHTALRLRYGSIDAVANWGIFDFNSPNFIYRFVKGETDYSIGLSPTHYFLMAYERENRRITEQTLNLTHQQFTALVEAVNENCQPQNRVYRYNYALDNCATRPLHLIEQVIGSQVLLPSAPADAQQMNTLRREMSYFHSNYPWYQFGIDMCLGSGVDSNITPREMMFAPVVLEELAATAIIDAGPLKGQPLVAQTSTLVDGPKNGSILGPTPWYLTPFTAMMALLAITILLTFYNRKHKKTSRWFDFILFTGFGIEGCIVTFLVFVSVHEATSPNWLLLWLNPLCFIVPIANIIRRTHRIANWYHIYNIIATALLFVIAAIGIQSVNLALIVLATCGLIRSLNATLNVSSKNK